jgi:hypothetical protein
LAKSELGEPEGQALLSDSGSSGQEHYLRELPLPHRLGETTPDTLMPNHRSQGHRIEGKQAVGKQ